jgi:hypothetical protein
MLEAFVEHSWKLSKENIGVYDSVSLGSSHGEPGMHEALGFEYCMLSELINLRMVDDGEKRVTWTAHKCNDD